MSSGGQRHIPQNYVRLHIAGSLSELFNTGFGPANVILYQRPMEGDFDALARTLVEEGCVKWSSPTSIKIPRLKQIFSALEDAQAKAAQIILDDMATMEGHYPELRVTMPHHYLQNPDESPFTFHEDGVNRILCCYGEATEWIRNEDADEHLRLKSGAPVFRFGPGDIWKQAGKTEISGTAPFIHRAPAMKEGAAPRLVLVASP